jgi:YD repeat-containing protein
VVLPDGGEQHYTYGPGDVVTEETLTGDDGTGTVRLLARKTFDYDERGRLIRETRLVFETNPATAQTLATEYTFDEGERLILTEDHRGAQTRMAYDGLSRPRLRDRCCG